MEQNETVGICVDRNTVCTVAVLGETGYCTCSGNYVLVNVSGQLQCEEVPDKVFNSFTELKEIDQNEKFFDISLSYNKYLSLEDQSVSMEPKSNLLNARILNNITSIRFDISNSTLLTSRSYIIKYRAFIQGKRVKDSLLLDINTIRKVGTSEKDEEVYIKEDEPIGTELSNVTLEPGYNKYELENCIEMFKINEKRKIVTINTLDRETKQQYICRIRAFLNDTRSCVLKQLKNRVINIIDVNDNPPKFTRLSYSGHIMENSPVNTTVDLRIPISSTDRDISSNNVTYEIVTNEFFYLEKLYNTREVNIKSTKILDRETHKFHHLSINASDGVNWSPVVNVTIVVLDVDEPPKFKHDHYSFNVSEKNDGGLVGTVLAEDNDEEGHDLILYTIKSGAFGKFRVDSKNGSIFLQGDILSKNTSYDFIIFATYENVTTNVSVFVLDINESPVFEKESFVFDVNESFNQVNETVFIGTIKAFDPDVGKNASLTYIVIESNPTRSFFFPNQPNNGTLFIQGVLDYEKIKMLKVVVKAVDGGNKSATATVVVHVRDVNDNKPIPTSDFFLATISSQTLNLKGKPVVLIQASDADSGDNGRLSYGIVDNKDGVFDISNFGVLTVENGSNAKESAYSCNISISDNGVPANTVYVVANITVDTTPLPLTFTENKITIILIENHLFTPAETIEDLSKFVVTDKNISFSLIVDGGHFTLNQTGSLSVKSNRRFDREQKDGYILMVEVKEDKGQNADIAVVNVSIADVNDNSPVLNKENIRYTDIMENASIGDVVITAIAIDDDAWNVLSFSIVNREVPFNINASDGRITVNQPLDREEIQTYTFSVMVSDGKFDDTANVTVYIKDVNDNDPKLTPASFNITESKPVGQLVGELQVVDADENNDNLSMTLITTEGCPIDIQTGQDTSRAEVFLGKSLDYRRKKNYICKFWIQDDPKKNSPSERRTVMHDLNINVLDIPRFQTLELTAYVYTISEIGTIVVPHINATDEDGVRFSIKENNKQPFDKFSIDDKTGRISISGTLQSVTPKVYTMIIVAEDLTNTSTAEAKVLITIIESEALFSFEVKTFNVMENMNFSRVLQVKNNKNRELCNCKFSLEVPNDEYLLVEANGNIILKKPFNREQISKYQAVVVAVDKNSSVNASARIIFNILDVNDNRPYFKNRTFKFEATQNSYEVGTIIAVDDDETAELVYSKDNKFTTDEKKYAVDNRTGKIYLTYTYEHSSSVNETDTIYMQVTDGKDVDRCTVEITVSPDNVNSPKFKHDNYYVTLSTNSKPGDKFELKEFAAVDKDPSDVIDKYFFDDATSELDMFTIDSKSGIITVKKSLEFETNDVLKLVVLAKDKDQNPKTGSTTINVVFQSAQTIGCRPATFSYLYKILFFGLLGGVCFLIVILGITCYKCQNLRRRQRVNERNYDQLKTQMGYDGTTYDSITSGGGGSEQVAPNTNYINTLYGVAPKREPEPDY